MTNGDFLHSNGVRTRDEVAAFQAGYDQGVREVGGDFRVERWLWFGSGALVAALTWFAVAWFA